VAIEEVLGRPGRIIAWSKSEHARRNPDHVLVFNANVCISPDRKRWWGDIDLTREEPLLVELAARLGETLFVLYEYDGRFRNERRPLLYRAVYEVTASGHYRFDHEWVERRRDGSLRRR
jgi:hypothetical protein